MPKLLLFFLLEHVPQANFTLILYEICWKINLITIIFIGMFSFCLTIPTKNSIHHQLHHLNDRCIFYRFKRKKIHWLTFWVYSLFTRCFIKLIYTAAQVRNTLMLIWNLCIFFHWNTDFLKYSTTKWTLE